MPMHEAGNVFPRAAFGLPITFEFNRGVRGEPPTSELLPQGGADRMASPLILCPYYTGNTWKASALLLPGLQQALTQPLIFKDLDYTPEHWPANPDEGRAKALHIRPMNTNAGLRADDPLSAFMHYFEHG